MTGIGDNSSSTLLWFANQRAVEYHPTLGRVDDLGRPTCLVLDIDPPEGGAFTLAVRAERLDPDLATTAFIREDRAGKVFLDSTRAGGATVAAAYSPRIRPGAPVSFPVAWGELERVQPPDFTVHTVPHLIAGRDPWLRGLPEQELSRDLIAEGHTIPIARVQAMHEGKRRARARRDGPGG